MRQPVPFGKYVLLERISVGGMAEVFKAKSFGVEGFEKILAIKRILPSLAEDSDFIEMFIDEAKICGQLNHANICQIFELGRVQDSHFIAMEYVWGKDLLQMQNRLRKQRQTMTPQMAAFIAAKLCEGLDYAHKKKDPTGKPLSIIHRDISPQNILVSYEGELKIIDFGIAKAASRSSKTQAGVLKGKFGYMSPEQVRGLPLDRRSDVFAIGTILYELLTSDRLFIGESDFETLEKVRNVVCVPPTRANPACPPALEKIILKALTKETESRYQWASEMQEDLQAFLMTVEPVFTAKHLSQWMREAFAVEMKREQEILEEQRRIGREVLTAPLAAGFGVSAQPISAAPSPPVLDDELPAEGTKVVDDADLEEIHEDEAQAVADEGPRDEFAEKTTISGPSFAAAAVAGAAQKPTALTDEKTAILADAAAVAPVRSAAALSSAAAPGHELPAQPTVILADAQSAPVQSITASKSGPLRLSSSSQLGVGNEATRAPMPLPGRVGPEDLPRRAATGVVQRSGTGQVNAPLPYGQAPRSTLLKDIAIGVAVAAALVGGVLGVRAYYSRGGSHGTLVVMTAPPRAAEVLVDGELRGRTDEGKPLTLKNLLPGAHLVQVHGTDGSSFEQTVQLAPGDVSVLQAALGHAPGSVGTGLLRLRIATEGAQVEVDGAQLADGAWRAPIPLRADVPHEIRVTKAQREEAHLQVTLRAGEELQKDIELKPGHGRLQITSDPDGAEVSVNGHRAGVTPATVGELDPAKQARVVLRKKGFQPITRYVSFDKTLDQQLDLKLQAAGEEGAGDEAPRGAPALLADVSIPEPVKTHAKTKEPEPGSSDNEPGFLVANTQPWAKVIIDGKDTGKTTPIAPRSKIPLKPGKHVVTFVANGKKFNFDIVVKPAEDTRLIKQLADTP